MDDAERKGVRRAISLEAPTAASLALATSLFTSLGHAQVCEATRPTDPSDGTSPSYGSAEVAYLDSPSGAARVHYALSGPHAPAPESSSMSDVPDLVVVAAQAADDAFDQYDALGYRRPLDDGASPCPSNGDSDAVDVYIVNFTAADGQAPLDHCEAGSPKRCAGFVLVENDFRGGAYADASEGMRTVVPHELFHLVQDAYDSDVERWWAEGSAQWAAKQVYPDLLDLERFLQAYFDNPWRPVNSPPPGVLTSFLYATAIWPVFLHERYDADVVREVYEGLAEGHDDVLPVTERVLQARDTSLAEATLQFASYNAATGERAPSSGGYAAATDYPLVPLDVLTGADGASAGDNASGLGAFYFSISASEELRLSLDAEPTRAAGMLLPVIDGKAELDQAAPLPATVLGDAIAVVAGQSLAKTDAPFTLQLSKPEAPKQPKNDHDLDSSGCALSDIAQGGMPGSGVFGLIMVSCLGRARARSRRRKDS